MIGIQVAEFACIVSLRDGASKDPILDFFTGPSKVDVMPECMPVPGSPPQVGVLDDETWEYMDVHFPNVVKFRPKVRRSTLGVIITSPHNGAQPVTCNNLVSSLAWPSLAFWRHWKGAHFLPWTLIEPPRYLLSQMAIGVDILAEYIILTQPVMNWQPRWTRPSLKI